MQTQEFTLTIKRFDPVDPIFGRHVRHDSRSWNFQYEAAPLGSLKSIRHRRILAILRQRVGSCTADAGVGVLGTTPFWGTYPSIPALSTADGAQTYCDGVYSDATKLDPYSGVWPPTDTGSDGLSVAKVLKARNLISGYQHAMSLEAALTALAEKPVIVGTKWLYDMSRPQSDGRIKVSGDLQGGHEYELDELDVENKRVWMDQSWGPLWGHNGRAYLTWDDLGALLADQGDCTIFVPNNQPAPTPSPAPQPTPSPTPKPGDVNAEFIAAAKVYDEAYHKFIAAGGGV